MRTTITLDDDVISKIRKKMREGDGKSFKDAVNETLRNGLLFETQIREKPRKPFKVKSRNLGVYPHLNYDKTSELLAMLDEEEFKANSDRS